MNWKKKKKLEKDLNWSLKYLKKKKLWKKNSTLKTTSRS